MLESQMKYAADYEWAVNLNRSSLSVIGLWPTNEYDARTKFFTKLRVLVFLTLLIFGCTIPCVSDLIKQCDDAMSIIDNLGYSVPLIVTMLKFVIIFSKKKVLLPVVNMIMEDWTKLKRDVERDVMIRRARIARTVSMFSYALISITIALLLVLPRLGITPRYVRNGTDVRKIFPLPTHYAIDAISETPYFEIIFVIQTIGLLMAIICYTGVDNLFGLLILHICGQFENLQSRLANAKGSDSFNHVLTIIIEDHVRLIRAVSVVESTFTLLLLALLLYFGTFSCIYGLLLIATFIQKEKISVLRLMYLLSILMGTFLQTSLYSIATQILANQSEGIFHAAYNCEWANIKSKKAKSLILIMARAKRPLYITAGKLFPMTMPIFCNILKISCSYISFLLTKL